MKAHAAFRDGGSTQQPSAKPPAALLTYPGGTKSPNRQRRIVVSWRGPGDDIAAAAGSPGRRAGGVRADFSEREARAPERPRLGRVHAAVRLLNWATLAVDNSGSSTAGNALTNVRLELAR